MSQRPKKQKPKPQTPTSSRNVPGRDRAGELQWTVKSTRTFDRLGDKQQQLPQPFLSLQNKWSNEKRIKNNKLTQWYQNPAGNTRRWLQWSSNIQEIIMRCSKEIWCHLFPDLSCSNNTHPSLFPKDNQGTALPKGIDSSAVIHNKGLQFSAPAREGASAK